MTPIQKDTIPSDILTGLGFWDWIVETFGTRAEPVSAIILERQYTSMVVRMEIADRTHPMLAQVLNAVRHDEYSVQCQVAYQQEVPQTHG